MIDIQFSIFFGSRNPRENVARIKTASLPAEFRPTDVNREPPPAARKARVYT